MQNINDECIICYEIVEFDYIMLECCNKKTHLNCIEKWIKTNQDNKVYLNTCFHCKQQNTLIKFISNYDEKIVDENINSINRQRNFDDKCKIILGLSCILYIIFMGTYFPILLL